MKRNYKKIICISLSVILLLGLIYGITFYFSFFQGNVTIKNNTVSSKQLPGEFKSSYVAKMNFNDMKVTPINNININVLGHGNINNIQVLYKAQRYYIPIETIATKLSYNCNDDYSILDNSVSNINLSDTSFTINGEIKNLRGNILTYNNVKYISISDIENIFNLTALYNFKEKTINLVKANSATLKKVEEIPTEGKVAMIRLEDFSTSEAVNSDLNQPKFKALGDFLYSQGIKFHIAWIPYYKCPSENIDNNLLTNETFENAAFINLLDYLINKGAAVGLHGYTHQYGDETSGVGTELGRNVNTSEEDTRKVVEGAIDTATALNIPYNFFESSHYKATSKQKEIISEYVQYIYEPMNYFIYTKLQKTNNNNLFIPTPLSYVKDLDISYIQRGLSKPRPNEFASLFYHPSKELDFINYNTNNNTFNVDYSTDSPIQKIVKEIHDNDYVTIHVSQLKK